MNSKTIEQSLNNYNIGNKKNNDINLSIWSEDTEKLLIDWADKSMCFRWLHSKSCAKYNKWNIWFTIPIIIISTSTGTANFSQNKISLQYRDYVAMIIGFFNITAAILTTIHKFFKVTELSESHRLSSISWDKFYRKIKVQLAQDPDYRTDAKNFLLVCQSEYDNLIDSSPYIEYDIIKEFHKTFYGIKYTNCCGYIEIENKKFKDDDFFNTNRIELAKTIKKPVICDDIESIRDYLFTNEKKKNNAIIKFKYLTQKLKNKTNEKKQILDFIAKYKNEKNIFPSIDILIQEFPGSNLNYLNNILFDNIELYNKLNSQTSSDPPETKLDNDVINIENDGNNLENIDV